jgi:hypothetical protein
MAGGMIRAACRGRLHVHEETECFCHTEFSRPGSFFAGRACHAPRFPSIRARGLARTQSFPPSGATLSKRRQEISGLRRSAARRDFRASGAIAVIGITAITGIDIAGITTGSSSFSFRGGN